MPFDYQKNGVTAQEYKYLSKPLSAQNQMTENLIQKRLRNLQQEAQKQRPVMPDVEKKRF